MNRRRRLPSGASGGQLQGFDVLILDTAGRVTIDEGLMAELREVKALTNPHEVLLVADAMTGQDAVTTATAFRDAVDITGIVLTRLMVMRAARRCRCARSPAVRSSWLVSVKSRTLSRNSIRRAWRAGFSTWAMLSRSSRRRRKYRGRGGRAPRQADGQGSVRHERLPPRFASSRNGRAWRDHGYVAGSRQDAEADRGRWHR